MNTTVAVFVVALVAAVVALLAIAGGHPRTGVVASSGPQSNKP
jgi:hypothetical protein